MPNLDDIVARAAVRAADDEREGLYPRDLVQRACDLGIIKSLLERESEQPTLQFCAVIEKLAASWLALGESVHLQTLATLGLARFGSQDLKEKYLGPLYSAVLAGGNCLSEPSAGSDLGAIELSAIDQGDYWELTGQKLWVGHAALDSVLNVYARTAGTGLGGISCFMVESTWPGVDVGQPLSKMGVKSLPTSHVRFDGVHVPKVNLLGRLHRGMVIANAVTHQGRIGIAACAVGVAQASLDRAVEYSRQRRQFGQPVHSFQGLRFLLAEMSTQLTAARSLLREAARATDAAEAGASVLASQAKLFATDMAMEITTNAVQVLGAYGYVDGEPVERYMREAKLLQIIEGTNQIHREIIGLTLR